MKLFRFIVRITKGIYDILATYLLAFLLPFILAGLGIYLGLSWFATTAVGYESLDAMWENWAEGLSVSELGVRLSLTAPAHILLFFILRPIRLRVQPWVEKGFDLIVRGFRRITRGVPKLQFAGELLFSLVVTAILVPFVIQPTLVSGTDAYSMAERGANLMDGTATVTVVDSVVGLYRKFYAQPVVAVGVDAWEVDESIVESDKIDGPVPTPRPRGKQPMMDRWDPYIAAVTDGDSVQFAMVKSFMWVESGGRQYAVSHTGCSGLMQFCSGTARSKPYREIFGRGQVYTCGCKRKDCRVPRDVQRDMESGSPEAIARRAPEFPCEVTDARFDPRKAIAAGSVYVRDLRGAVGNNIYMMYIGYNSGPGVARRLYRAVGKNSNATLAEIEPHLADALRPSFGASADRRARSLLKSTLPRLGKAYVKYSREGIPGGVNHTPMDVPVASPVLPKPVKPKPLKPKRVKPKPVIAVSDMGSSEASGVADAGASEDGGVGDSGPKSTPQIDAGTEADMSAEKITKKPTPPPEVPVSKPGTTPKPELKPAPRAKPEPGPPIPDIRPGSRPPLPRAGPDPRPPGPF